jgi:hypothetical protein
MYHIFYMLCQNNQHTGYIHSCLHFLILVKLLLTTLFMAQSFNTLDQTIQDENRQNKLLGPHWVHNNQIMFTQVLMNYFIK